jgi:hypothetical protein
MVGVVGTVGMVSTGGPVCTVGVVGMVGTGGDLAHPVWQGHDRAMSFGSNHCLAQPSRVLPQPSRVLARPTTDSTP